MSCCCMHFMPLYVSFACDVEHECVKEVLHVLTSVDAQQYVQST